MYLYKKEGLDHIEFISRPSNFSSKTYEVLAAGVTAGEDGRKIVPRGTILPANDATAEGILMNDIDVTYGNQPGALMDAGYVYKDRLPETPAEAAITALAQVVFE